MRTAYEPDGITDEEIYRPEEELNRQFRNPILKVDIKTGEVKINRLSELTDGDVKTEAAR